MSPRNSKLSPNRKTTSCIKNKNGKRSFLRTSENDVTDDFYYKRKKSIKHSQVDINNAVLTAPNGYIMTRNKLKKKLTNIDNSELVKTNVIEDKCSRIDNIRNKSVKVNKNRKPSNKIHTNTLQLGFVFTNDISSPYPGKQLDTDYKKSTPSLFESDSDPEIDYFQIKDSIKNEVEEISTCISYPDDILCPAFDKNIEMKTYFNKKSYPINNKSNIQYPTKSECVQTNSENDDIIIVSESFIRQLKNEVEIIKTESQGSEIRTEELFYDNNTNKSNDSDIEQHKDNEVVSKMLSSDFEVNQINMCAHIDTNIDNICDSNFKSSICSNLSSKQDMDVIDESHKFTPSLSPLPFKTTNTVENSLKSIFDVPKENIVESYANINDSLITDLDSNISTTITEDMINLSSLQTFEFDNSNSDQSMENHANSENNSTCHLSPDQIEPDQYFHTVIQDEIKIKKSESFNNKGNYSCLLKNDNFNSSYDSYSKKYNNQSIENHANSENNSTCHLSPDQIEPDQYFHTVIQDEIKIKKSESFNNKGNYSCLLKNDNFNSLYDSYSKKYNNQSIENHANSENNSTCHLSPDQIEPDQYFHTVIQDEIKIKKSESFNNKGNYSCLLKNDNFNSSYDSYSKKYNNQSIENHANSENNSTCHLSPDQIEPDQYFHTVIQDEIKIKKSESFNNKGNYSCLLKNDNFNSSYDSYSKKYNNLYSKCYCKNFTSFNNDDNKIFTSKIKHFAFNNNAKKVRQKILRKKHLEANILNMLITKEHKNIIQSREHKPIFNSILINKKYEKCIESKENDHIAPSVLSMLKDVYVDVEYLSEYCDYNTSADKLPELHTNKKDIQFNIQASNIKPIDIMSTFKDNNDSISNNTSQNKPINLKSCDEKYDNFNKNKIIENASISNSTTKNYPISLKLCNENDVNFNKNKTIDNVPMSNTTKTQKPVHFKPCVGSYVNFSKNKIIDNSKTSIPKKKKTVNTKPCDGSYVNFNKNKIIDNVSMSNTTTTQKPVHFKPCVGSYVNFNKNKIIDNFPISNTKTTQNPINIKPCDGSSVNLNKNKIIDNVSTSNSKISNKPNNLKPYEESDVNFDKFKIINNASTLKSIIKNKPISPKSCNQSYKNKITDSASMSNSTTKNNSINPESHEENVVNFNKSVIIDNVSTSNNKSINFELCDQSYVHFNKNKISDSASISNSLTKNKSINLVTYEENCVNFNKNEIIDNVSTSNSISDNLEPCDQSYINFNKNEINYPTINSIEKNDFDCDIVSNNHVVNVEIDTENKIKFEHDFNYDTTAIQQYSFKPEKSPAPEIKPFEMYSFSDSTIIINKNNDSKEEFKIVEKCNDNESENILSLAKIKTNPGFTQTKVTHDLKDEHKPALAIVKSEKEINISALLIEPPQYKNHFDSSDAITSKAYQICPMLPYISENNEPVNNLFDLPFEDIAFSLNNNSSDDDDDNRLLIEDNEPNHDDKINKNSTCILKLADSSKDERTINCLSPAASIKNFTTEIEFCEKKLINPKKEQSSEINLIKNKKVSNPILPKKKSVISNNNCENTELKEQKNFLDDCMSFEMCNEFYKIKSLHKSIVSKNESLPKYIQDILKEVYVDELFVSSCQHMVDLYNDDDQLKNDVFIQTDESGKILSEKLVHDIINKNDVKHKYPELRKSISPNGKTMLKSEINNLNQQKKPIKTQKLNSLQNTKNVKSNMKIRIHLREFILSNKPLDEILESKEFRNLRFFSEEEIAGSIGVFIFEQTIDTPIITGLSVYRENYDQLSNEEKNKILVSTNLNITCPKIMMLTSITVALVKMLRSDTLIDVILNVIRRNVLKKHMNTEHTIDDQLIKQVVYFVDICVRFRLLKTLQIFIFDSMVFLPNKYCCIIFISLLLWKNCLPRSINIEEDPVIITAMSFLIAKKKLYSEETVSCDIFQRELINLLSCHFNYTFSIDMPTNFIQHIHKPDFFVSVVMFLKCCDPKDLVEFMVNCLFPIIDNYLNTQQNEVYALQTMESINMAIKPFKITYNTTVATYLKKCKDPINGLNKNGKEHVYNTIYNSYKILQNKFIEYLNDSRPRSQYFEESLISIILVLGSVDYFTSCMHLMQWKPKFELSTILSKKIVMFKSIMGDVWNKLCAIDDIDTLRCLVNSCLLNKDVYDTIIQLHNLR